MDRLEFDGFELTYEAHRAGEPVVLIHASPFVSWYRPLLERLTALSTLTYRRRPRTGDGGYRPLSVAEDAAVCARLMDHVGWPTAHVVGHSYGALVALQLALDEPERVASAALLEPAARGISSSAAVAAALQPVVAAYRAGDTVGAVDAFLRHVGGVGYRDPLERAVPGAFDEAVAEADVFFQAELPAVQGFTFGPDEARRVTQPLLDVLGADTEPRFVEGSALVRSWFPAAEHLVVPDAGHLLMVQNPNAVAQGLLEFFARHPISTVQHTPVP